MEGAFTLFLLFLLIFLFIFMKKRGSRLAKKLGAKIHTVAMHLHGVPGMEQKEIVKLFFTDDKMIVKSKKKTVELNYEKLTAIKAVKETDLLQQDKSVIGRGIVGGLLLGPAGAIVAGMSAIGGKKNVRGELLIINYKPNENAESQVIIFNLEKLSSPKKIEKFVLKKRPDIIESDYVSL